MVLERAAEDRMAKGAAAGRELLLVKGFGLRPVALQRTARGRGGADAQRGAGRKGTGY